MNRGKAPVTPDHLFLNLSLKCNMRCFRCYGHLQDHSQPIFMDMALAEQATAWYMLKRNIQCRMAHIMFFGGEPLLNWSLIEEYLPWYRQRYAREKVRVCLFTNGLELYPDRIDYLQKYKVLTFVSFDGMEEIHRENRDITSAHYTKLRQTIRSMVGRSSSSVIPYCVIDKKHLPSLDEILETLASLQTPNIAVAKDFAQNWSAAEKDGLYAGLLRIKEKYNVGCILYPEFVSDCIRCSVKSIMVYPDGNTYDLCYVCASVGVKENRLSAEQLPLFFLGNFAQNDTPAMDREAKKSLMASKIDCPTLTRDHKLLSNLACRRP